jgi:hypothetical protein
MKNASQLRTKTLSDMVQQAQLELPAGAPNGAPDITPAEIERLVATLADASSWMTAKDIAQEWGGRPGLDRRVRAIASASAPRIVSFPGSPGYKLFERCTVEEINHCIEAFNSQGSDMIKRASLYSRAYHRRCRAQDQ